eukprot:1160409-Pelagomonas_calceolata.AAC.9
MIIFQGVCLQCFNAGDEICLCANVVYELRLPGFPEPALLSAVNMKHAMPGRFYTAIFQVCTMYVCFLWLGLDASGLLAYPKYDSHGVFTIHHVA